MRRGGPHMTAPSVGSPLLRSRLGAVAAVALLLGAVGCSGSDSENVVPLDTPPPGVLYVSTASGQVQELTPATGEANVLVTAPEGSSIVDVAPARQASGAQVLMQTSLEPFVVSAFDLDGTELAPVEAVTSGVDALSCLDPHPAAETPVAHEIRAGDANGNLFRPVALGGPRLTDDAADRELASVACPRWNAARTVVATAVPLRAGDPSSVATVVQTVTGERHQIAFDSCGTTPTSFSPDDRFLAVAVTCYSAAWDNSGLYLVPIDDLAGLAEVTALADLERVGEGLYGRTSWYPGSGWIAGVHADPIEEQNIAQDLSAQPVGLQLIELSTGRAVDVGLAGDAGPFSLAWFENDGPGG